MVADGSTSFLAHPLAVEGVQPLIGDEGVTNERKAELLTPGSVNQRTGSANAYEGLSPAEALSLSNKTFPSVSGEADGGPPSLPEGQRVAGFPSDFAMSVQGGNGSREVREALEPVALEEAPGQRTPIDLSLTETNDAFQPKSPLAPVGIPERLAEGAALPAAGVTVTPVDEYGSALPGGGLLDGASVFYGASESAQASVFDLDTIVKPATFGLTIDQILRSQRSPSKLFFKFGLPEGASLEQEDPGSGPVRVLADGRPIVAIFTPTAQDAQGTNVPVSMSVDGDTLVLTVEHPAGAYAYPIVVDPRYEYSSSEYTWDKQLDKNGSHPTNWHFEALGSTFTDTENGVGQGWTVHISGSHGEHELGDMVYTTQGASHIWDFASETAQLEKETHVETLVELEHKGVLEQQQTLSTEVSEPQWNSSQYCRSGETCPSGLEPGNGNSAVYESVASKAGTGRAGENILRKAEVAVQQTGNPEVKFDTTDETVNGHPNALYGAKTWLGPHTNALVEFTVADEGIGIEGWSDEHTNSSGSWLSWSEKSMLSEGLCSGIQCPPEAVEYIGYSSVLPDGKPRIGVDAWNALYDSHAKENEVESSRRYPVRVDSTPPQNIKLSGLGPGGQVGAGEYTLTAEATDGSGITPSSGVKSLAVSIDGHEVGSPGGSCASGPCTAHRTLTIFGHSYATGRHIVTVEAADNAGNTSSESFTMIVHPASPISLGPGSFNPQSGEYALAATDVSMGGGLTVSRSYDSEHPTAGTGGPLGAQWQVSLGSQESLVKQSTGSYVLTDSSGAQTIFAPSGSGGYISPAGDSNLELSSTPCEVGQTELSLRNAAANTTTCFKVPSGGSGEIWAPHITQGQVATDTVTYSYETAEVPLGSKKMVTRPHEALAPVPAGVSCSPTLKAGCRALSFNYATSTTAKGEARTEWGDIEGNLTRVYYTAWEPTSKEMKKVEVAHYEYDEQGRLRTVWDPRIKPEPLKTYYGYDSEGHVTAMTSPGQETLGIVYGTISGSANPGAVLKVTQAPSSTTLWSGEGLSNTEAPKLTGVRTTGVRMSITEGKWSGNPIVYGYQWEDCTTGGSECVPIPGANNANYTPTSKDEGARLAVVVTATNGSGSASATVYEPTTTPTYVSSFGSYGTGSDQLREPEGGLAVDASGNVWVSDTENSRLEEFNAKGEFVRTVGSQGEGASQFLTTYGVTVDSKGDIWATDEGNDRVEEFNSEGTFLKMFGWGVSNGESKLQVCTSACRAGLQGSGNGEFYVPEGIVVDSKGDVFVADRGNHRVQEFNSELAWVRNLVQPEEHEGPFYLSLDSSNDVWVAYSSENKIGEFNSEGKLLQTWGKTGSEPGKLSDPYGVAVGAEGDIWVSEYGNNRVQVFTPSGGYLYGFGSQGNGAGQFNDSPHGLAFSGSNVYVLDSGIWSQNTGNSRIEKWAIPNTKEGEGEPRPVQPGSTVEYKVPVSGSGAPYAMGAKEVEEGWAQKDLPVEATAVFPPDEPEGWPAGDYKRATVYYRDGTERTVNVAGPGGGISTSEYNSTNDLVRSLIPDNRATALKEAKPAVVAKELDSQSEYNSEETQLLSTLGPRHAIKLANGEEVQARNHTVYEYDNGAPAEGGPYHLVTKTTEGAEIEGKGEQEVRTTLTGYSGQSGLGWKLRRPTSTTTSPGGLNLTRTTVYDETTGNVLETTTPAANKTTNPTPTYVGSFGSYGSGNGQLLEPEGGLAVDASGDVWVSDTDNSRLEEFNSKGEFVRTVGSQGGGAGQFLTTYGVTVDSKGNIWATDEGNDRVEEFNSEGTFLKMFGWGVANGESKLQVCTSSCRAGLQGSGNGEFFVPEGIVVDSKGDVFVADRGNHRVQEFNSELVWVRNLVQPEEHEGPFYLSLDSSNNIWVAYSFENKIGEFNSEGKLLQTWGKTGSEPGKLSYPYGVAVGTEGDIWVSEYGNNRVQVFTPSGEYLYGFGSKGNGSGQFNEAPHGLAFSGSNVYVLDSGIWSQNTGNSRIEKWAIPNTTRTNVNNAQTIYYTTAANSKYTKCGEHPEWAGMPCQSQSAEQPTTAGIPGLPVTIYSYNMYGEPTQTKSEVARAGGGTDTRTTTTVYDEAGRPESTETSSTVGAALPKVTDKYSATTGSLIEQSTSTESLKSEYNRLGQLTSYTDADGNQSTYEYEKEKDYRLKKMSDGKGAQTYEYNETTGAVKELKDTQGTSTLTFTALYDVEGNMTSETYPNAMSANYTRNTAGEVTGVEYVKTADCAKTCPETWYSDAVSPSIHDQWITQQSSQVAQTYSYDEAGRLTQVLDNVAGKGCTTRVYGYEEESNRLSLTTRPPGTGGACASEGGEVQNHSYDPANRLTDAGTEYDSFGNTTKLPAADAGGTGLTSTFYEDNQLASQTQGTQTIGDQLDPAGRTREIVSTGKVVATEIQHYDARESRTPSWTGELSANYTRYITGIGGAVVAIRHDEGKAAIQLSNLQGDIVATAQEAETATALESTISEASEYGVPTAEGPPKYAWLGAQEIRNALPSGIMEMGARSYVPQLGRFLQADPRAGGSANAYGYTDGDPVNETDLTGEYVENDYVLAMGIEQNARAIEREAAREAAVRKEAEERAEDAAIRAQLEAEMAAEIAAAEAQDLWDAEATAGPPGSAGGGESSFTVAGHADFVQCKHKGCSQYCVEHAKSKSEADKCPKGPVGPAEECITGAFGGALIAWIPGVDIGAGEAAAAGCAGVLGSPEGELHGGDKKDD